MIRRLPLIPTLLVLAAVAVMIRLGFWQLERMHEKEALIARAQTALTMNSEAQWPRETSDVDGALYRHTSIQCLRVVDQTAMSGQNAKGEAGWAQVANCALPGGGVAKVVLGWSQQPPNARWQGGAVSGVIAPGPRLVAMPAQAGLAENAVPDPANLPNNHLSYAVQWFLFAIVALVIYVLAVRKRLADRTPPR